MGIQDDADLFEAMTEYGERLRALEKRLTRVERTLADEGLTDWPLSDDPDDDLED